MERVAGIFLHTYRTGTEAGGGGYQKAQIPTQPHPFPHPPPQKKKSFSESGSARKTAIVPKHYYYLKKIIIFKP